MTRKAPFPECQFEQEVIILVLKGQRPSKPHRFDAPGMTPAVWEVAEKCWRQEATERPEVRTVLGYLEDLANSGMYTREAYSHLEREMADP